MAARYGRWERSAGGSLLGECGSLDADAERLVKTEAVW